MKLFETISDYWLTLAGILEYQFHLKKSCFRTKDVVLREQYQKLKKLLMICQTEIPYYQNLFKEIGFEVERDFKTLDDLQKIPITEKSVVKEHPEWFVNQKRIKGALTFHTSGSTGKPLTEYVSRNHWKIEQGVVWRHWSWGGYKFRNKIAVVRSYTPKNGQLIKQDNIRNFRFYSPFHLSDDNIKMYLEDMIEQDVKFIRGYPSSVKALAVYVLQHQCEIPKLKGILTASEVLRDSDREIIENAFKCKISNHYGLAECVVMMGDCEKHEGLHNYDEYGYLELLDTDDPKVKRIVGTNLNNYAMPLLRYDTNDFAEVADKPCSCGRSSMVVHNIRGRSSEVIKLKDREVPLVNFFTMMEYYTTLKQWQIVQTGVDTVELRLSGYLTESELNIIHKDFAARLPEYVKYEITMEKEPIQKYEGKIPPFIVLN
jgi:phenylacetate-CoA ligase